MTRPASATFRLAVVTALAHQGEPLFDALRTALEAAGHVARGDEYRADRAEQETMTHVPVSYAPLVEAFLPVADVLAGDPAAVEPF